MNEHIVTIATNTVKEILRQATFYFIVGGGLLMILLSFSFTMFAFGEEARMIREMGISSITLCCLFLASLSAAGTLSKEVEKGIILTLLSKPVTRKSILLGKFFGVLCAVSIAFIMMGVCLIVSLLIKECKEYNIGFLDAFEGIGRLTILQLIFSFLQVAIMTGISIALSVYLPVISNISCCMFIYIIGNGIGFFKTNFLNGEGSILWLESLFYVFFPNLEGLSIVNAYNSLYGFSFTYLIFMLVYSILYLMFVLSLSCYFFETKECV
ncbi:MAG TPA: ABC transporter permease subunit [Candidatus Wujingus californicus]|uniref:ABC transporter permease subunit n=3 Tax=Candidatus Wujingus californicus TaxID=3367618 RepID=UPI001D585ACC|nr:ABC transporter permease subunit [Planctomycetota bacterium]MDO8131762.1 ABC transporter permease subunit [Candidatus Brocadiales bacterium]